MKKAVLGVLLFSALASYAHADQIETFTISGTDVTSCLLIGPGTPIPGCTPTSGELAGALEVDATTGTAIAMDVFITNSYDFHNTYPGSDFNHRPGVGLIGPDTCLGQYNPGAEAVLLMCITTPIPGSLLGFDGGTIIGFPTDGVSSVRDNSNVPYVYILGGDITPVVGTPEPGVLAMLLCGLMAVALFCLTAPTIQGRRQDPREPAPR
jgi:hypothetical protein